MTDERISSLEALLAETSAAHAEYETTELNGVYDQEWARWYAQYALDHGLESLIGRELTSDELAMFLEHSWQRAQSSSTTKVSWASYTARAIADELTVA